ncbi:MAG: GDSL-type esterase/lipase family protein [Nitrospirota bacterium]|nr:GDSL-type esterase/lipase family protein [Nitrospirota bacterium]
MKLLFIGDSLIEYYDWQERFSKYLVYNLGIAGETVEGLYARLEVVFAQIEEADAIFIMTGINNLAMGDSKFLPVYRKIVKSLKEHYTPSRIFLHSLLPVLFPWISNDEIVKMNRQLKKMAGEENVLYVDMHSLFLEREGRPVREYLLDDGVHVSEKGYRVWAGEIERLL